MKAKTKKLREFFYNLHQSIVNNPNLSKNIKNKPEKEIQGEVRFLIINYLKNYYREIGYKDWEARANKSFYWEGQDGKYGKERQPLFSSKNYPDFIITHPYLIAIEYKQSESGSTVKHGIGQSIMHTMSEDFHYVYYLFHDQSKNKKIEHSTKLQKEKTIVEKMWKNFNVFIRFI
jgi:hypothetical protein